MATWKLPWRSKLLSVNLTLRTDYRQAEPANLLLMGAPDLLAEVAAPRVAEYRRLAASHRRSVACGSLLVAKGLWNAMDRQLMP